MFVSCYVKKIIKRIVFMFVENDEADYKNMYFYKIS